jgi:hypothetical protein
MGGRNLGSLLLGRYNIDYIGIYIDIDKGMVLSYLETYLPQKLNRSES